MDDKLYNAMADLKEDLLFPEIRSALDSGVAQAMVLEELQKGMIEVGPRFEAGNYFLSELIISGETFKKAVEAMGGDDTGAEEKSSAETFLIGTVEGDIHDIGKNIAGSLLQSNGFKVVDIGINVKSDVFVDEVKKNNPDIIGLSCLLTTAFNSMKTTVDALRAEGLTQGKMVMIGGGPINEQVREHTGADAFCNSAQDGVVKAKAFMGV